MLFSWLNNSLITHLFGFNDFESPQRVHLNLVNALAKLSKQKMEKEEAVEQHAGL